MMAASEVSSPERTISTWRGQASHEHEDLVAALDYLASLIIKKPVFMNEPHYCHSSFPQHKWHWNNPLMPSRKIFPIWDTCMTHPYMALKDGDKVVAVAIKFEKIEDDKTYKVVKIFSLMNWFEIQRLTPPNKNVIHRCEVVASLNCEDGRIIEEMLKNLGHKALLAEHLRI